MACGLALKRPHEYDAYLSPDGGEAKRSRQTNTHCSPFRAQMGTIAASLPATSTSSSRVHLRDSKEDEEFDSSPFSSVSGRTQLSSGQLESYLRAEVRYLKRRRLIPRGQNIGDNLYDCNSCDNYDGLNDVKDFTNKVDGLNHMSIASSSNSYRVAPSSPTANSGSDSESECAAPLQLLKMSRSLAMNLYDKPQFSLKQVQLICERLLKQQEVRLRYEYETVLNKRLEEQHEQYVQFAREQIERQNQNHGVELSYLS